MSPFVLTEQLDESIDSTNVCSISGSSNPGAHSVAGVISIELTFWVDT